MPSDPADARGADAPAPDAERAVFLPDGERLLPTGLARGPWYPGTQHGSAMLGLLARAVDRHPADRASQVTRFTADMMRAAPMRPVETRCRTLRAGRSLEILEATIEADDEVYARATALRFRIADIDVGDTPSHYGPTWGGPTWGGPTLGGPTSGGPTGARDGAGVGTAEGPDSTVPDARGRLPDFGRATDEAFHHALDMRPPLGVETPSMWLRMTCPLVAGETLSPFVCTAIMADWTYSVPHIHRIMSSGGMLDRAFSAINPDTSINLHRPMRGEWLRLDGQAHYGSAGAGTALAFLSDESGPIGHASQAVLIRTVDKRPAVVGELQGRPAGARDGR